MLFPGLKNGLPGKKSHAGVDTESNQSLCVAREKAIDEAVRRCRQQRPILVELSLNPSHEKVRQQVADRVRMEYHRIMAEGTIAV